MSPTGPTPYLRASDADREATVDRLRQAAIDGRLDADELEERVAAAYAAKWTSDLDRLTADVVPPPAPVPGPYPPYAPPPPGWPQPKTDTNGLAAASLIASLFWVWAFGSVAAVIFGHIALRQIDRSDGRQSGRGMAIAGLVIGYLGILATAAGLAASGMLW